MSKLAEHYDGLARTWHGLTARYLESISWNTQSHTEAFYKLAVRATLRSARYARLAEQARQQAQEAAR